jgi:biopolymer transport protein TolQ
MINHGLLSFFTNAGPVVKVVMLILLAASLLSWTLIFQRGMFLKHVRRMAAGFDEKFWSGTDLNRLYTNVVGRDAEETVGLANIFKAGYREYTHLRQRQCSEDKVLIGVERAMTVAESKELDAIESHLSLLATIGSTSPYIGLFGTVWGIMTSFQALGSVEQATVSMVAPGISEALIATAMGLFAAIPAVIAYNRYTAIVDRLANQYTTFKDEFSNLLFRQVHQRTSANSATSQRIDVLAEEEIAHG